MNWLTAPLGDVCLPTLQADPARSGASTFRYVDIAGVDRDSKIISRAEALPCAEAPSRARKIIQTSDVLVSTVRPNLNAVALVSDDLDGEVASTGFSVLRANPVLLNPKYLFYWVQSREFIEYLVSNATGASYPAVTDGVVRRAPLPLASPKEQSRIIDLLDEAYRLRLLRREAEVKAGRILPVLFLKMFGDPATNPKGWPTERLDVLFDVFGGGTPSKAVPDYWQGDIPWVSPKDMKSDVIEDTEDHITNAAIANSATKLVEPGSILIVYRSGILAHTFPVAIAGRSLTLNQDLKALNSRREVSNEFLYGWLVTGQSLALSCVKKGATVHNIDGPRFLSLQVPRPPHALQNGFAANLKGLLGFKGDRERASAQIDTLFSLLLRKAFSGQLTAKWREAHMKELLAEMAQQARTLNLPLPRELEAQP
ncbi:restriction endonuclease subunit S [Thiobacillus sp. 65-1402]|uniref:restriction endonuclease subunit S n=1 Tax=Thiobacillus sp. 65-1402 TaxID=1895861 RepID=UPI000A9A3490|nr:restriction endonuclease subunit S [Thiobacillus sp. 65-1402]